MFKKEIYQSRRDNLKKLVKSGLIVFPANSNSPFNGPHSYHNFRQDSSFLYFSGIDHPDYTLVIDVDSGDEWMYGDESSRDSIYWSGKTPSLSDYCQKSGIQNHASTAQLIDIIKEASQAGRKVHFLPPYQGGVKLRLADLLNIHGRQLAASVSTELVKAVVQLRSLKDEYEIKEIETAINIAHKMHTTAMILAMPGAHEQDIKGVLEGIAVSQGGALSFQPIVTIRGDILHNPRYSNTLESDSLLVVDAGAESALHYASDITRTIPVGRSFTRLQRNLYEIVLRANEEAIKAIQPGIPFYDIHQQASLIIAKGLKDLGIMKGDPEEAVKLGAHALFFPHGLGHMLGLDAHDMEALGEDFVGYSDEFTRSDQFGLSNLRLAKALENGNVVTVEPGIYFIEPLIDTWRSEKRFSDFINYNQIDVYLGIGGIRIEDNLLVTEKGCKVLGKAIPKSIKELETL